MLEGSQDPHNVHAVLRTAEALGLQDVHLVAPRGDAARISPGVTQRAHEWLSLQRHGSIDDAAALLRKEGRALWATANAEGARSLTEFAPEGRIALLFGNETEGLSERAIALADGLLRIDLVGFSGSLNLSVTAAMACWELRRREVLTGGGDLDDVERDAIRRDWYPKLLERGRRRAGLSERWLAQADSLAEHAAEMERVTPRNREDGPAVEDC